MTLPSAVGNLATSIRVSLTRTGEGADAAWLAEVEDVPGSSARAVTPEEAARRAVVSIQGSGEGKEASQRRPQPRHSGRLLVRMPATLHDELARAAEAEGVSLNQMITGVLASAVGWRAGEARGEGTALAAHDAKTAAGGRETWVARVLPKPSVRVALAANLVVVVLCAILAIALLVVAWQQG